MSQQHKILISGGWGYANLGDDAILDSTIRLVRRSLPNSQITVMTYSVEETASQILAAPDVLLKPSVHYWISHSLFGKFSQLPSKVSKYPNLLGIQVLRNIINKAIDISSHSLIPLPVKTKKQLIDVFSEHSTFIQSGGGYFSVQRQMDGLAHSIELEMASKTGLKTLVIGQSISGSQDTWLGKRAYNALKLADKVVVRDTQSQLELSEVGIPSDLLPDLAMENFISPQPQEINQRNKIALIVANENEQMIERIINVLRRITKSRGMSINVMVSRKWTLNIHIAKTLGDRLKSAEIPSQVVIPETWWALQEEISDCCLMISRHFHPLVMAARAGVPFIAINNHRYGDMISRKFDSFLEYTDQNLMVINTQTTEEDMEAKIKVALQSHEAVQNKSKFISEKIIHDFDKIIKSL